jgi:hypothetical protein
MTANSPRAPMVLHCRMKLREATRFDPLEKILPRLIKEGGPDDMRVSGEHVYQSGEIDWGKHGHVKWIRLAKDN